MAGLQPQEQEPQRRHHVTTSMIDTVKQVAPRLSDAQIRYDLERTGNVNETVDRYLNQGTLPFPPDYHPNMGTTGSVTEKPRTKKDDISSEEGPFGGLSFEAKREQLVQLGRKKLEEKLGMGWNDITKQYGS